MIFELTLRMRVNILVNHTHKLTCGVKDANAVSEASVRCTWKHEFRKTELPYTSEALERASFNNAPKGALELLRAKFNQIVDRVADALRFVLWFFH